METKSVILTDADAGLADATQTNEWGEPVVVVGQTNLFGDPVLETLGKTRAKTEKGDGAAQYQLGFDYYVGQGVRTNYVEAVKWFRKAAEQGNARAQNYLGYCYLTGKGGEQSVPDGVKWYRKSAEQGDAESQAQMGILFSAGKGVTTDHSEAVYWLSKAAAQSNSMAQTLLGQEYYLGRGVTKNYAEARKWFLKAAEKEEPLALHYVGLMYLNGDGFLESVPEVSVKLKDSNTNSRKFEDVVNSAERAAVLVLCRASSKVSPTPIVQAVPNFDQNPPTASDVSSDHSVDKVLDDGNFVRLEDGSVWQIFPYDTGSSSSWSESSEVTIIKVDNSAYPYKLINTDDDESVRARQVRNR